MRCMDSSSSSRRLTSKSPACATAICFACGEGRRTGNLCTVQLLLGHAKIESTIRYLGIAVDDALAIAEHVDV